MKLLTMLIIILLDVRTFFKYHVSHGGCHGKQDQSTEPLDQGRSSPHPPSSGLCERKGRCGVHGSPTLGRSSSLPALRRSGRVSDEGCQDRRAASKLPLALPWLQGSVHRSHWHRVRGQPDRASALVF